MKIEFGLLVCYILTVCTGLRPCAKRKYNYNSYVCVCNSTYCDELHPHPEQLLQYGHYIHFVSSIRGQRMESTLNNFNKLSDMNPDVVHIKVNITDCYQEVLGFGGAMSDSSGINIVSLSNKTQETLLRQYFAAEGAEYTFIRIPLGGSDFSPRYYTYDDVENDTNLIHFHLAQEDLLYKIPFVKRAIEMSNRNIKLYTASWSAPNWMKESHHNGFFYTRLQNKFYKLYADYHIRFFKAYEEYGLNFWALSPQNEPTGDIYARYHYNSMGWTPEEEKVFIRDYLGPALERNTFGNIKIMVNDDQRFNIPAYALQLLNDEKTKDYISGIAVHFYFDNFPNSSTDILTRTHNLFPEKFILYTEACFTTNMEPDSANISVQLGNWNRGEKYIHNIIQNMNHWATGWTDWNLVLDLNGGPNWAGNHVDAAVIVNSTADEFYKQPMYYAIAHFSKFVVPGSKRIGLQTENSTQLDHIGFIRPDGVVVLVLLNRNDKIVEAVISTDHGDIQIQLPEHSMHTILYNENKTKNGVKSHVLVHWLFILSFISALIFNM